MNYDFEYFSVIGTKILTLLGVASVKVFVLAGLIFLLLKILRVKNHEIQHLAWVVVLVGMLILPFSSYIISPPISFSVLPESLNQNFIQQSELGAKAEPNISLTGERTDEQNYQSEIQVSGNSVINQSEVEDSPVFDVEANIENSPASSNLKILITNALLTIYLGGFILMFFRLVRGFYKTGQIIRKSQVIEDENITNLCQQLIKNSVFNQQVKIFSSAGIKSPVTTGFLRSKILLPEDWMSWEELKIKSVLAHETAHIGRKDYIFLLLTTFNKCLNWFNPLSWLLARRISELAEIASDNSAISLVGNSHKYAEYLLEIAAKTKINIRESKINGVTMVRNSQIFRRIELILQKDKNQISSRKYLKSLIFCFSFGALFAAIIFGIESSPAKSNEILISATPESSKADPTNKTEKSLSENFPKNNLISTSEKPAEELSIPKQKQNQSEITVANNFVPPEQTSQKRPFDASIENNTVPSISNSESEPKNSGETFSNNIEKKAEPDEPQFVEIGNHSSVEELISTLNDSNPALREKAAAILKQKGDKRAVEPLIRKLTDGNAKVRQQAAEALGTIGDQRAVSPLLNSLKDGNPNVRQMTSKALGDLGNDQAVESLRQMTADNNQTVRQAAENSLRKLNKKIKE